jgi:hypothetical protein
MHEIKRVAEESTSGSENAGAPIAATNKLRHRLSTLPVADFSASSNVKWSAQPARPGRRATVAGEDFRSLETARRSLS